MNGSCVSLAACTSICFEGKPDVDQGKLLKGLEADLKTGMRRFDVDMIDEYSEKVEECEDQRKESSSLGV
jgi:hypothetical protein